MACVMVPARIDRPEDTTPTLRLRGVALVERLHELAREGQPGELESVLRALPARQWTSLEGASRSWRLAPGGGGSTRRLAKARRRWGACSVSGSPGNAP